MLVQRAQEEDIAAVVQLSLALWPDANAPEQEREVRECLKRHDAAIFVARSEGGRVVGFLEAGIRFYAEDCATHNVGYIEGWYVDEEFRQQGVGAALVKAAEEWARSKGCREMASDCLLDNEVSLAAHLAVGYAETSRIIHFVKAL